MSTGLAQRAMVAVLPVLPRGVVSPFARRYVAGADLDAALAAAHDLAARGRAATFDVLGEEHRTASDVDTLVAEYRRILHRIGDLEPEPTLSVRMTGLGFRIDPALCWEHLLGLARDAADRERRLTIDMEDSSTTTATLDAYRRLRAEGLDGVGIVLQAYLRRSLADLTSLAALAPRVRVVKGIWVEPPAVAHDDFDIVRARYVRLLDGLLAAGSYVEIATHDEWLVDQALHLLDRHGRGPAEYEFQMLLGVREDLGDLLVADGHPLRVYVPYGQDWYGYCLRRLKENPRIAGHVVAEQWRRVQRRHDHRPLEEQR